VYGRARESYEERSLANLQTKAFTRFAKEGRKSTRFIKKRDSGTFAQIYIIKRQRSKHVHQRLPSAVCLLQWDNIVTLFTSNKSYQLSWGERAPPAFIVSELCNHVLFFFLGLTTGETAISTSNPVSREKRLGSMSHPACLHYYGPSAVLLGGLLL
jgi:hypothetical protein